MIETNFDNCVGPLHCVCSTVAAIEICNQRAETMWRDNPTKTIHNYFPQPFCRECLLNDYIIYFRMYEKQYCVIAIYCDNCQNHV